MYAKQNRAEVRERAEIRAPVSAAADGKKEKEANFAFLSQWQEGEGGQPYLPVSLRHCLSLKQFESKSTCNYLE